MDRPGTVEQVPRGHGCRLRSTTTGVVRIKASRGGNRPPRVAFPTLPELPTVPDLVDPDRWLQVRDGLHLVRKVRRDGSVRVDLEELLCGSCAGWATRGPTPVGSQTCLAGRA